MNNRLKRNWIAVSIIWAGALIMTYLNVQMIQQMKTNWEKAESMRMDGIFLKNSFDKVARVLKQRALLHKPTESLQLELLSLEDNLKIHADAHRLVNFRMSSDIAKAKGDHAPIEIQVTGAYKDAIIWLKAIETDFPFLPIADVIMTQNKQGAGFVFDAMIDFRYKISAGRS